MRLAALFFLLTSSTWAQLTVSFPGPTGHGASTPNLILVEAVAGNNGSSGTYTCTFGTSTTSGELVLVQEGDYASNPSAPSVPTASGMTFSTDKSLAQSGAGRLTFFSAPNVSSGTTVITINPASGASSGVCSHWKNAATTSPLDIANTASLQNSSATAIISQPISTTQADVCVGAVYNRASGTDTYSSTDVWTTLKASADTSDGDQLYTQYIINGVASQFTMNAAINNARTQFAATACYKAASPGSFTGQTPTVFMSMTGTNGTAVTLANLPINPNLAAPTFGSGTSCFTYNNANGLAALTTNATNGTQYTGSGTNAIGYSLSCNNATDNQIVIAFAPATAGTVTSAGVEILYPNTAFTGDNFNMGGFVSTGTNTDRCYPFIESANGTNYDVKMETALADSASTIDITSQISGGVPLWITYKFDTSALTCTMGVYNASTGAQIGSNISHSVQTGSTPATWSFGRFDGGASTGTAYYIRAVVDFTGTFPLKP